MVVIQFFILIPDRRKNNKIQRLLLEINDKIFMADRNGIIHYLINNSNTCNMEYYHLGKFQRDSFVDLKLEAVGKLWWIVM